MTMPTLLLDGRQAHPRAPAPPAPAPQPTAAERAWAALRYIEAHPREWDQGNWACCFAGVVVWQAGEPHASSKQIYRAFRELLDIGWWRALNLVQSVNGQRRLRRLVRRYFGPDPHKETP